ncbi:hypothetical protein [Rhodoglobus sp.]
MSVFEALRRVILDEDHETAVAALDWALHSERIDLFDLERLIIDLPGHKNRFRSWADGGCESLPESLARTRLQLAGHSVEIQVPVGSKRIDMVIDGIIGLEINGRQFHAHTFEEDHLKGIEITIAGFHAMSVSAQMVFHQWGLFEQALDVALALHSSGGRRARGTRRAPSETQDFRQDGPEEPRVLGAPQSASAIFPEFPKGVGGEPRGLAGTSGNNRAAQTLESQ